MTRWVRFRTGDGSVGFGTLHGNHVVEQIIPPTELVSLISQDMTLLPGDVIAVGTSLGVGSMKDGAKVEVQIDGIGVLTNWLEGEGATGWGTS